jgi:hypothetical protein
MVRWSLVLLVLLFSSLTSTLPAASLQFGPNFTFSDPEPGQPGDGYEVLTAWVENGQPVVIIQRFKLGLWRTFRAQVRGDGTVDNGSVIALNLPPGTAAIDRRGNELFAVVRTDDAQSSLVAARLDTMGRMLSPAPKLIAPGLSATYRLAVTCNATQCFVVADHVGLLLDADGNVIKKPTGMGFLAAAGDRSFLVQSCLVTCTVDLLDENGTAKSTLKSAVPMRDAIYDGNRFVVLFGTDGPVYPNPPNFLKMSTVDPVTGSWSTPRIIYPYLLSTVNARLAWNGSMYAVAMIAYPYPTVSPIVPEHWVQTLRIGRDLVPLDAQPRRVTTDTWSDAPLRFIGTADGFLLICPALHMPGDWTSFIRNDGTIDPAPPSVTPLLRDVASQTIVAGASSRASRLAMWTENDGQVIRLRAARRARTGELLDVKALTLANAVNILHVSATSDGDAFLVAWIESLGGGPIRAALIDAAGTIRAVPLDNKVDAISVEVSFENGAYHLTAVTSHDAVEAFTVSSAGALLLHDRVDITRPSSLEAVTAAFDGRRIAAAWAHGSLWTTVKDVQNSAMPAPREVMHSGALSYTNLAIRPDGAGGYLLLYPQTHQISFPDRDERSLVRLSPDGELLPETNRLLDTGLFTINLSLLRIGGNWYATWNDGTYSLETGNRSFQVFVPFDGATLNPGRAIEVPDLDGKWLVPGWNEALLLFDTPVQTELGPISLATMQVVGAPARGRAVGH